MTTITYRLKASSELDARLRYATDGEVILDEHAFLTIEAERDPARQ